MVRKLIGTVNSGCYKFPCFEEINFFTLNNLRIINRWNDDKPVAKKRPAAAGVTKKPATKDARTKTKKLKKKGRPTGGRTGCPKCRGRGCSKCKNPKYKGTRITEAEYNARKRKKKSK